MPRPRDSRVLLWAVVASQFGPPFMFSGVAVALPEMGRALDAGATLLGLVETLFLAGILTFLLPAGRLADASDRSMLYKLGLLGFGVTSLLVAALPDMRLILPLRFVQGALSALTAVAGSAVLADLVPAAARGRAFGLSIGAVYAGLVLGPVLAGFLADAAGWRAVFAGGGTAILLGWLFVWRLLPSGWRWPARVAHVGSTLRIAAAALALVGGSALLAEPWLGAAVLAAGLLLAAWFVRVQLRSPDPLLDLPWLLANRTLRDALLVQLLLYMAAFSSIFLLSIYLQVALGRTARAAGQVVAIGSVAMALLAPVAGMLADRFGPARIARIGVAAVAASTAIACALDRASPILHVIAVLALQGIGFALFSSPNMATIMNAVPAPRFGIASAVAAKARSLGMVAGMLLTAVLISLHLGNRPLADDPPAFVAVLRESFLVLAVATAAAWLFARRAARRAAAAPTTSGPART